MVLGMTALFIVLSEAQIMVSVAECFTLVPFVLLELALWVSVAIMLLSVATCLAVPDWLP